MPRSRKNRRMPSAVVVHLTNHWPNQPEVGSQIKPMNLEEKSDQKMHHQFLPLRSMKFLGGCPIEGNCVILFDAWFASPQIVIRLPSSTKKRFRSLWLRSFCKNLICLISLKPCGTCSGSMLYLSITGIWGCPHLDVPEVSKWLASGLFHLLIMGYIRAITNLTY